MKKKEKLLEVLNLKQNLNKFDVLYLVDIKHLNSDAISQLRRISYKENTKIKVVKNTLIKKAMQQVVDKNYIEIYPYIKGNTAILFSDIENVPAKMISNFRKKLDKPILKAAWIHHTIYIGDHNLNILSKLKSKNELIGEIINMLQFSVKNIVSSLQFGNFILTGIIKKLSKR